MGDEELQPSKKKRAAGRELSRDNPGLDDDEETPEQEMGTFKRASDEVMAGRKIVKVRRNTSAPASNPFSGIQLVPPTDTQTTQSGVNTKTETSTLAAEKVEEKSDADKKVDDINELPESGISVADHEPSTKETDNSSELKETKLADEKITEGDKTKEESEKDAKANNGKGEASKDTVADHRDTEAKDEAASTESEVKKEKDEAASTESEVKKDNDEVKTESEEKKDGDVNVGKSAETTSFSSFQQLSTSQNAFTGLAGSGFSSNTFSFGSVSNDGSGSLFGVKTDQPAFSFGLSSNGSSLFASSGASIVNKSEKTGFPSMQEVPVETGEENEKAVFTADSVLFEFSEGAWKERGKGELKVNVSTVGTGKARLIMRTKGNYRLILNASLYPDMKLTNMDKKGITFACINSASEGKDGLSTYALKFKDASFVEEFRAVVTEYKDKTAPPLKTPENSPKASNN